MNIKWITAIVVIFGLLAMFYIFNWPTVLKSLLIFSCVVLIGCVLLQAGRGGGLAAIGGLADQSMLGTQTGSVLTRVTYLVGASFIFTTILLTKLTLTSIHGADTLHSKHSSPLHEVHEHAGHDHAGDVEHDDHAGHVHSPSTTGSEAGSMGMRAVNVAGEEQEQRNEAATESKSIAEEKGND